MTAEQMQQMVDDMHITYGDLYAILMESDTAYKNADKLLFMLGTTCDELNEKNADRINGGPDEKIK